MWRALDAIVRKPATLILLVVAATTISSSPRAQVLEVPFGRYHALLIANSDYASHGAWNSLPGPSTDTGAIKTMLEDNYGFEVEVLANATKDMILDTLWDYRQALTKDDNLLIYYAGHGKVLDDQGYWIGIDGAKDRPTRWLSGGELAPRLNEIKAKHIIVVSDSCYAGTLFRADVQGAVRDPREDVIAWWRTMAVRRTRQALASGNLERVLDGGGPDGLSVFAGAFLGALQANDTVLEAHALFEQIKVPVMAASAARLGPAADAQQPTFSPIYLANDQGGDFLFVRKGFSPASRARVAPQQNVARTNFGIRGDIEVVSSMAPQMNRRVDQNPLAERLDRLLASRFLVADHLLLRLDGGQHQLFETTNLGGTLASHSAIVLHFTAGGSLQSTLRVLGGDVTQIKASAHVVIDRDGSTAQLLPFDMKAWHAGRSQLTLPDGNVLANLNAHSIGIELVNVGRVEAVEGGWRPLWGAGGLISDPSRIAILPDGSTWEAYSPEQIDVTVDILQRLVATYGIEAIVGHQDIDPRKSDPGPAFPMEDVLARVFGLDGVQSTRTAGHR